MQTMNDAESSNEVERLYRRNTLFTASIIAVYSIAGGRISSEASVGVVKINFGNPGALDISLVVVAMYFCWRHWLVSRNLRQTMLQNIYNEIDAPKWIWKRLENEIFALKETIEWPTRDFEGHPPVVVDSTLIGVNYTTIRYRMKFQDIHKKISERFLDISMFACPIFFLIVSMKYRYLWAKKALTDTHFGDGVLPLLLTIVSVFIYFVKSIVL